MNANELRLSVTLDTNVPQQLWRREEKADLVQELLALFVDGRIDLAVTTRIRHDTPLPPLADRIDDLLESGVQLIGAPFTWNLSEWNSGDFWVSEQEQEAEDRIRATIREQSKKMPGDADFDHVLGHHAAGRDLFLTWDEAILGAAEVFHEFLGVHIGRPEEFLAHIDA